MIFPFLSQCSQRQWGRFFILIGTFWAGELSAQSFTGPCTRRTSVVLSEIHYHPPGDEESSRKREFIELTNSSPISVDLSGWKIAGEVDFEIPEGVRLEGGEFLIIAADPASYSDLEVPVLGPWQGGLSNKNGLVRIRKASGGIVLETEYRDDSPWPLAADGAGHSLVLARPSYGESRAEAWSASAESGGSPGRVDPPATSPLTSVIISEVLSASDPLEDDFVEFYNPAPAPADLSGCLISNHRDLPGFAIPAGTILAPGAYLAFPAGLTGFVFDEAGDEIFLRAPDGLQVIAARKLGAQETGHSRGGLTRWVELANPTPGLPNSVPHQREIVINELHYHPLNDEGEFVELANFGSEAVDLSGWELRDGIGFTFPAGSTLPAGGFLVVAENRAEFLSERPGLDPMLVLGDYSGSLSNSGERIELRNSAKVVVDEVSYFDGGQWPTTPDGGGTSLQLVDHRADHNAGASWRGGDESGRATTVILEHTGVLDLGHQKAPRATRCFIMMMGEGEIIVDNFQVIVDGDDRVRNGDFSGGLGGWTLLGTHKPSFVANGALHVLATDGGDLANLIEGNLASAIRPGATVTIRATCRWVSGDPEILLGVNGGWLEAAGAVPVPDAVGTPGNANFGAGNLGPAITEVSHFPLLPQTGEAITIRARVTDPDGVGSVRLRYRNDPGDSIEQIIMTPESEGFYRATIPAQTARSMIAYHLLSIDSASSGEITRFPAAAPERECLVRVGEEIPAGDLSTMRIWITSDTLSEWRNRERSSNLALDATFVSDGRVFYNCGVHYAGSQNGVTIYDSPIGNPTGYNIALPNDEVFLNVQKLTLDRETTRDATRQRERLLFWFLDKLGLPNLHRRYVHVFLNGVERDELIMEDVQKPNRDVMEEWFPDRGRLTKTNPWFEFEPNGNVMITDGGSIGNRLQHYRTTDGSYKLPRYRWNWSHGAGHDSAHDFSGLFDLIDAANAPAADYPQAMAKKADLPQWMRTFAANDLGAYWDTFGNPGSKNAYLFESLETGKWSVIVWDMDVGLGVFGDPWNAPLFVSNIDPAIIRLYNNPSVVRSYWQALDESLKGFFGANPSSEVYQILAETYEVLRDNGAAVTSPFAPSGPDGLSVDRWINLRRSFLQGELAGKNAPFTVSAPVISTEIFASLTGTAPLATTTITANGIPLATDFTTIKNWQSKVSLQPGPNAILIEARDRFGILLGLQTLNITYTGSETWAALVINEWMASNPIESGILDPADGKADDWFELYNPTSAPVSLDGWYLSDDPSDLLQFPIPNGFTIPAKGHLLVWADGEISQNDPATRQEIHASFKLSADGDSIILSAPNASEIDRVDFGAQTPGVARLRRSDGDANFTYSLQATPGLANVPPPAAPITEVETSLSDRIFALQFQSVPDTIYEIQSTSDLKVWKNIGSPLIGDGFVLNPILPEAGAKTFYRINSY